MTNDKTILRLGIGGAGEEVFVNASWANPTASRSIHATTRRPCDRLPPPEPLGAYVVKGRNGWIPRMVRRAHVCLALHFLWRGVLSGPAHLARSFPYSLLLAY